MPIANVELNTTFDEWRIRTNQLIVQSDQNFLTIGSSYDKANAANLLAYNVSLGANAYAASVGTAGNNYALSVATSIGTAGNAYTVSVGTAGNNYALSVASSVGIAANAYSSSVGISANAYAATVGTAGNSYAITVGTAGNAYTRTVGTAGNTFASSVGTSANAYATTVGTAGNAYTRTVGTAANTIAIAAFGEANSARTVITDSLNATRYIFFANGTTGVASSLNVSTNFTFNPSTGTVGATNFNSTSDINLKYDIEKIENALDIVGSIEGIKFKWKNNNQKSIGVLAQNIEKCLPELVNEINGYKTVNYDGIIGVLIESVKSLKEEIDKLKNQK